MMRAGGIIGPAFVAATTALLWLSSAGAAEILPGATVESVVALAKRLNPVVAAAALDFDAAFHKIGTAGVLADPTLSLEAWDVNSQGVAQRRFGINQEFKLWGKYGLERSVAQADANAVKYQGQATVIDLVAKMVAAHGEYNAAYEAVGVSLEIKRRFDEILGLLKSRYGTTPIDQQDVIKAEIEAASAEGEVMRRQGKVKSAAARLNVLIAQVQQRALSANPLLAMAGAQLTSAARSKSIVDFNYYPDVNLGAKYIQRRGVADTGVFQAAINSPLQYEAKDAAQRVAAVPVLVDNARNGFQAGSSDHSLVFESERRLRAVQLDLLKLKVELQMKYAEMERLTGGSL